MWFLPLLVIGAIAVAVASRSPRDQAPPGHPALSAPPHPPGPISTLGEYLRVGQLPPPPVIICAIAEAEALGREDLATNIVRIFVAPVVYQHQLMTGHPPLPVTSLPAPPPLPAIPPPPPQRCLPPAGASTSRGRGSYAAPPSCSPRAKADARSRSQPKEPPAPPRLPAAERPAISSVSDEEIRDLLNTDPARFVELVARYGSVDAAVAAMKRAVEVTEAAIVPTLLAELPKHAGFAGAGVVVEPSTGHEAFEVRWVRGHAMPPLPPMIEGRPLRRVFVEAPATTQPAAVPEAAPILEDQRPLAAGSPIVGVADDAWREFARRLEREDPAYSSPRHVGQYRQRRERLAELGIDPAALVSPSAQRSALDVDLADAHRHAVDGELIADHVGRVIEVPSGEGPSSERITLSGLLAVVQCAGLDGAVGWLERPSDRTRYPHTTQAFLRGNEVF